MNIENKRVDNQVEEINEIGEKEISEFFLNLKIQFNKEESGFDQIIDFSEEDIKKLFFTSLTKDIFRRYLDKPDLVKERFKENVDQFNISADEWKQAALKQPQLFYQSPETLNANISRSSELMGIDKNDFVKVALKQPSLFCQFPETLNANISRSSELMGIDKNDFVKAALKQPQLFCQFPETLNSNITKSSELMGIDKNDFVKAALKQPQLFCQSPETLFSNFIAILFDNDDIKTRKFVLKNPVALCYSQERDFIHYLATKITSSKISIGKNPRQIIKDYYGKQPYGEYLEIKQFPMIEEYLTKKIDNNELSIDEAIEMTKNEKLFGQFMLLRAIEHFERESKKERK